MTDAGADLSDGVRVAALPAAVDVANAMDVRHELSEMVRDGVTVLVADMAATTSLSLEGLQVLLLARTTAARRGAQLRLAAIRPHILRFMELTGTSRLFSLYPSVKAAREARVNEPPEPVR